MSQNGSIGELTDITQALNVVYNPQSEKSLRNMAQKYLDSLHGTPNSVQIGYHLAHKNQGYDLPLRHFGLLLMKSAIIYHWTDDIMGDVGREQIKFLSLDLLINGLGSIENEKQYIVENIAKLVSEVAKRVWPLQWIDLDIKLQEAYNHNPVTREAVIHFYRLLAEDVFLYDNPIAELRKSELTSGLMAVTASTNTLKDYKSVNERNLATGMTGGYNDANLNNTNFDIVMDTIRGHPDNIGWLNRWTEDIKNAFEESENNAVTARLLYNTLKAINVFMEWTPLQIIIESKIVYVLINLLKSSHDEIRLESIQSLISLVSRNLSPTDQYRKKAIWEPFFNNNGINEIINLWIKIHSVNAEFNLQKQVLNKSFENEFNVNKDNNDDEDEELGIDMGDDNYKITKKIVQLMISLGEIQIIYRRSNETPENFSLYLNFMVSLFAHKGLFISSNCVVFWIELLRHEYFQNLSETDDILSSLLTVLYFKISDVQKDIDNVTKYELVRGNNDIDFEMNYFDELDFDSNIEFREFALITKNRLLDVIKSISALKPIESFNWIVQQISLPLNLLLNNNYNESSITAFTNFSETVISSSSKIALTEGLNELYMPLAIEVLTSIIKTDFNTPFAIITKLSLITSFTKVIQTDTNLLMPSLESIFNTVTYISPNNSENSQEETKKVRRKATNSLMIFAKSMANLLSLIYNDINLAIQNLISNNKINSHEKSLLYEFLLIITCFSKLDHNTKINYFNNIIDPIVNDFNNIIIEFENDEQFLSLLGLKVISENKNILQNVNSLNDCNNVQLIDQINKIKNHRSHIIAIISSLYVFSKRTFENKVYKEEVVSLWSPFISKLTINLLKIIKRIHWLWTPTFKSLIPEDLHSILLPTFQEKAELSGVTVPNNNINVYQQVQTPFSPNIPGLANNGNKNNEFDNQLEGISKWLSIIRNMSYLTLTQLTELGINLYSIDGFISALSESLFDNAPYIEIRHWSRLIATVMNKLIANCPPQLEIGLLNQLLPPFFDFVREKLDKEWEILKQNNPLLILTQSQIDLTTEFDSTAFNMGNSRDSIVLSEELLHEKLVRDMTRAYSNLFIALLTSYNVNDLNDQQMNIQQLNNLTNVGQKVTQLERFFNNENTATALVKSISSLVQYKDSTSVRRTLLVIPNILSSLPIEKNIEYSSEATVLLLESLLNSLKDPYHKDLSGEFINLITDIYIKLDSIGMNKGKMLFKRLEEENSYSNNNNNNNNRFNEFEKEFQEKTTLKLKIAIVKSYLNNIIGKELSEMGNKKVSKNMNDGKEERNLLQRPINRRDSGLDYILDNSEQGSVGISELFEI